MLVKREREREQILHRTGLVHKSTCRTNEEQKSLFKLLVHARLVYKPGNRNLFVSNQRGMKKLEMDLIVLLSAVEFVQWGET